MNTPLISIIIPMRNGDPFIASTLRSILAQHDVALEIIVINDGSTDQSPETVRKIGDARVRMIDGPRNGISAAFNAGLAAAKGEYLARCDADDLYPAGRLSWQSNFLQYHADFGAISGAYTMIDPRDRAIRDCIHPDAPLDVTDELLNASGRSHMCAYLFRTELLRTIGGCREWFATSEDADLQFRLADITRIGYQPTIAYLYRLHDSSITHSQADAKRKFFEQCAATFLKQRRSGQPDDLQAGRAPTPVEGTTIVRKTRHQVASILIGDAWRAHRAGQKRKSLSLGWRAAMRDPLAAKSWIGLAKLALKPAGEGKSA